MEDLISREALMENYGLKNAVKYGNETADQQHNSYSTLMLYEIADMILDAPAVDAVPIVRCGECIHRRKPLYPHPAMIWCPLIEHHHHPDWFCAYGRREKG